MTQLEGDIWPNSQSTRTLYYRTVTMEASLAYRREDEDTANPWIYYG
jgi:hypothetical protein